VNQKKTKPPLFLRYRLLLTHLFFSRWNNSFIPQDLNLFVHYILFDMNYITQYCRVRVLNSPQSERAKQLLVHLTPPLCGFFLEFGKTGQPQESRITGLPGRGRSLTTSLAVWVQYVNASGGQTPDGRTDTGRQPVLRLRTTLRGKK